MRYAVSARLVLAFGAAVAGACSFTLSTSDVGLMCGPNGTCLPGYSCTAQNTCEPAANVACNPTCGALEACVRQVCVPACLGERACPSGTSCSDGVCFVEPPASSLDAEMKLGGTCTTDSDCMEGTAPSGSNLFCLIPFGGHSNGFCTAQCASNAGCGAEAPWCQSYATEGGSVMVCAPGSCDAAIGATANCTGTSLLPCATDADCSPSGLVCGVYETGDSLSSQSVIACRSPIPDGGTVGTACNPTTEPCENGLCVPTSTPGDYICTTTCDPTNPACSTVFSGSTTGSCEQVTVGGTVADVIDPNVRPNLCAPTAKPTLGNPCSAGSTSVCGLDAPICFPLGGDGGECVCSCTDNLAAPSERCPSSATCDSEDGGSYCLPVTE